MSYLASLRRVLYGKGAGPRAFLYILAAVCLLGLAWWLLPMRRRPTPMTSQVRKTPLQRVSQRVATAPPTPKLHITEVRQTGQVVELKGTAECDATLMINGERVPLIFDQCGFKHFLLLPDGPSTIAVTAQGPAGGVNTQLIKVNVE